MRHYDAISGFRVQLIDDVTAVPLPCQSDMVLLVHRLNTAPPTTMIAPYAVSLCHIVPHCATVSNAHCSLSSKQPVSCSLQLRRADIILEQYQKHIILSGAREYLYLYPVTIYYLHPRKRFLFFLLILICCVVHDQLSNFKSLYDQFVFASLSGEF